MHPLEVLLLNAKMWGYDGIEAAVITRSLDVSGYVPSPRVICSFRKYSWLIRDRFSDFFTLEGRTLVIREKRVELDFLPPELFATVGPGDVLDLPGRIPVSHKWDMGAVLVIGGSLRYTGAPVLAALGALNSGPDIVMVHSPNENVLTTVARIPALIPVAKKFLDEILPKINAIVIGPGMTPDDTRGYIDLLRSFQGNIVLDAGAISLVDALRSKKLIITPHAGEFRKYTGMNPGTTPKDRILAAVKYAKDTGVVVVLKGPMDIITNGTRVRINLSGIPEMTVGGTGDVLAGIIGGLIARGTRAFSAASAACFLNGLAAWMFLQENESSVVLSSSYPEYIGKALARPFSVAKYIQNRIQQLSQYGWNPREIADFLEKEKLLF